VLIEGEEKNPLVVKRVVVSVEVHRVVNGLLVKREDFAVNPKALKFLAIV